MASPDWPLEAIKAIPGFLGSLVASMFFGVNGWKKRAGMFFAGAAIAHYGGGWLADRAGLDIGFASFLLGLFGMAFVEKIFHVWETFELTTILRDALRKVLGLPPKET